MRSLGFILGHLTTRPRQVEPAPGPDDVVPDTAPLVLVGDSEAEERFYARED